LIEPEHRPPLLTHNQIISLVVGQLLVGIFIIFMGGTILHYYFPVSGDYGVYIEGIILGVLVVVHVNRVAQVYREAIRRREDE